MHLKTGSQSTVEKSSARSDSIQTCEGFLMIYKEGTYSAFALQGSQTPSDPRLGEEVDLDD